MHMYSDQWQGYAGTVTSDRATQVLWPVTGVPMLLVKCADRLFEKIPLSALSMSETSTAWATKLLTITTAGFHINFHPYLKATEFCRPHIKSKWKPGEGTIETKTGWGNYWDENRVRELLRRNPGEGTIETISGWGNYWDEIQQIKKKKPRMDSGDKKSLITTGMRARTSMRKCFVRQGNFSSWCSMMTIMAEFSSPPPDIHPVT